MLLDHQLAQQIVDRTMLIIGKNINVMNHAGTIIASGDNDRIGKIHDGALLALKHGDTLEVNHGDTPTLKGVKPGINLLLKVSEQVIGVVGITGDPNTIRSYAELVKMTAEMIVKQAELIEQLQWDRRHKEEFITAWIQNKLSKAELENWSSRLEIDLSIPRVAAVIRVEQSVAPMSQNTLRKIVEILEYPQGENLVAVLSFNEIVILKPYPINNAHDVNEKEQQILEKLFQRLQHLLKRLQHNGIDNVNIALGKYFKGAKNIAISFKSAQQVMLFGQIHQPKKNLFLFNEVRLPVLLSPLTDTWQAKQLSSPYAQLLAADKSGQLVKTLHALFAHQGNLTACAESLFIHRNTLRYRLNKIEKITGTSPHEFSGLVELYLAHLLTS